MKLELFIVGITAFLIYNTYHDGKYSKMFFSYKKYFQMAFFGILGLSFYLLIKRDPAKCKKILMNANEMVKYLPIDKTNMDMISPIIDFTSSGSGFMNNLNDNLFSQNQGDRGEEEENNNNNNNNNNGFFKNKRSVSESRKKIVASKQGWRCSKCKQLLQATYEIDHIRRLDRGGTNEVDNLTALCPNCHREKTMMENL